ncbi:MAG TPA: LCP family protein [Jatrophihabitans sp.]|nr:LCP family protein [Jatrophihabitans sp.]
MLQDQDRAFGDARPAQGSHRAVTNRRHSLTLVGRFLAAGLSASLLIGFGYGWYEYRALDSGLHRLHLSNLGKEQNSNAPQDQQPVGEAQNILLVGLDSRDGLSPAEQKMLSVGDASTLSTDTIMVIHVPADGSRATMFSIPRDSFVAIPGGYVKNKINAAYADGYTYAPGGSTDDERRASGANTLVGTVSKLTGLRIDHYVQVGFGGFYTIAKALGGISVNLCAATNDTHVHNRAEGFGWVGSNFKMSAGHHHLSPVQSLEFVRQRHNLVGGDIAREKRQRYFLTAAFNEIVSANVLLSPSKLNSLIKAVDGAFYVDDNGFSLLELAHQMQDLSANKITGGTIPTEGTGTGYVKGVAESVVKVNPAKVQEWVSGHLSGAAPVKHKAKRPGHKKNQPKNCVF